MLHFIPLLLVLRMLKQTNDPLEVIVASEADNDLPRPAAVATDLDWCTQRWLAAVYCGGGAGRCALAVF